MRSLAYTAPMRLIESLALAAAVAQEMGLSSSEWTMQRADGKKCSVFVVFDETDALVAAVSLGIAGRAIAAANVDVNVAAPGEMRLTRA